MLQPNRRHYHTKLVDKFTYLGSSVSSTEKDIDTRLTKASTAIDRRSIIRKSDLTDKMKRSFFQAAVVSILLYGCTTWTLTKRLEKKLDGNYTRILGAILNKSWRQHPTRHQLYGHLPPITKTIQVRRSRHTGHCWRNKDELLIMWLIVSSLSLHSLHLLFCCVSSILALIWLVLMALSCAAIGRDSVSLLRFPFLSQVQVFWWEMLFISRLKQP